MKKLLIIMTLFMSSFFLFSLEDVKAEEVYIVDYDESVLDLINDEFFKVRDIVINYAAENSYNYIIRYSGTSYAIYFTDIENKTFISTGRTWFENLSIKFIFYLISSSTNYELDFQSKSVTIALSSINNYTILDSNMDIYYNPYSIQINYMDKSYFVDSTNKMPTLYDIYLEKNNIFPENPHQEEIDKLSNFYNLIIEKLGYFGEILVNNYIYLSIIVIFILIFVFKLIFRRFL